jgi:hypothetical protein
VVPGDQETERPGEAAENIIDNDERSHVNTRCKLLDFKGLDSIAGKRTSSDRTQPAAGSVASIVGGMRRERISGIETRLMIDDEGGALG